MSTSIVWTGDFTSRVAGSAAAFPEPQGSAGGGGGRRRERGLVVQQFEVIGEMLSGLETLTAAGQRHSIGKILAFIRARLRELDPLLGRRNRETVGDLLDQLEHEAGRPWPNLADVRQRTESLLALLPRHAAQPASTVAGIPE